MFPESYNTRLYHARLLSTMVGTAHLLPCFGLIIASVLVFFPMMSHHQKAIWEEKRDFSLHFNVTIHH